MSNLYSLNEEWNDFLEGTNFTTLSVSDATVIPSSMFLYNKTLQEVSCPQVYTIGNQGFYGCSKLSALNMPNLENIGNSAFYNCSKLYSNDILNLNTVKTIGVETFMYCSFTGVSVPNLESLGAWAFAGNANLGSISLPNTVTDIPDCAFNYCTNFYDVTCSGVQTIGSGAFQSCNNLLSINLPNVTFIGSEAFAGYSMMLQYIYLPGSTVCSLAATNVFPSRVFKGIRVPASLVDTYKSAENWSYYSAYIQAISE